MTENSKTVKSITFTPPPVVGAMDSAKEIMGKDLTWIARQENAEQILFTALVYPLLQAELSKLDTYLNSKASMDHRVIIDFLQEHGYTSQLNDDSDFYIAGVFKMAVEWIAEGLPWHLPGNDLLSSFNTFRLDKDFVEYFTSKNHNHPVVQIPTKTENVSVFISPADQPSSGFEMYLKIMKIMGDLTPSKDWANLFCPCVDLDHDENVEWILGMIAEGKNVPFAVIDQAVQKTKFKMDHLGAEAESMFEAGLMLTAIIDPIPDLYIDQPFYVWIMVDDIPLPVFSAWICQEDWVEFTESYYDLED